MKEFLSDVANSKSKSFLGFCLAFLVGIFIASVFDFRFDFFYFYVAVFGLLTILVLFRKRKSFHFFILLTYFFIFGFVRYSVFFDFSPNDISKYNGSDIAFEGVVIQEPDTRIDGVRYILEAEKVFPNKEVSGRVYVKLGRYPDYKYGDLLRVSCDLKKPEKFEDFRFDKFLAVKKVFSFCVNAEVEKIGEGGGNFLMSGILRFKNMFAEKINSLWLEPYASFVSGLLYGYRGGLGDLQEDFNATGVSHIVAISGYNITIIAVVVATLLTYLYIPRKQAFWIVVAGVAVFVLFTGAGASVVRAGVMGILVLISKQIGRVTRPLNMLVLAGVAMSLHNPFVLVWDAGFQLSFTATAGLIYLSPKITERLKFMPEFFGVKEALVSTLSAIIATLPMVLYYFERLSLVSIVVNVLILWIIPFIMLFGFLSVIASFVFYPLAFVLSAITYFLLLYVVKIVEWFANLPFASVDLKISVYYLFIIYFLMIFGFRIFKSAKDGIKKI